jgi:endoglucanase
VTADINGVTGAAGCSTVWPLSAPVFISLSNSKCRFLWQICSFIPAKNCNFLQFFICKILFFASSIKDNLINTGNPMKHLSVPLLICCVHFLFSCSFWVDNSEKIRLNQIGFYPNGPKKAVIITTENDSFEVRSADYTRTVFKGALTRAKYWFPSGESARIADFSDFKQKGSYVVFVPGLGSYYRFEIRKHIYFQSLLAALKSFYYQRASTRIEADYAGKWDRPRAHLDQLVTVHPSAFSYQRYPGTMLSSPKGWYDAGDFNKYIVNAGITTYTLMALFEHYPSYIGEISTAIPESEFLLPDILDEAKWSLEWILTMQDTSDGGVYHKVTHANFCGPIMPHEAKNARFIIQKSTSATLNFCAVLAMATRVYNSMIFDYDRFTEKCLKAALYAWDWAIKNPDVIYDQERLNRTYQPRINTGEYGDFDLTDEFQWAAIELYLTTGEKRFIEEIPPFSNPRTYLPSWQKVSTLGFYSLAHYRKEIAADIDTVELKRRIIDLADRYLTEAKISAYRVPIGRTNSEFEWGSNGIAANQGIALIQAYRLTGDTDYLYAAHSSLDYLFGRNATGYCFVTGLGKKSPMFPHHRQSQADEVEEPVPGFLVGGPHPGKQDGQKYPSNFPAKCYLDSWESYSTNEIAINWNAALVYLIAAIEASLSEEDYPDRYELLRDPDYEL